MAASANISRHSWLTAEFLANIIKSSENQSVTVTEFTLHDAVAKGENYCSYLIRAAVKYVVAGHSSDIKQKMFVIKTTLDSEEMNEKLKKIKMYEKEVAFYRDILPKFKKYTNMIDKDFKCAPRCFEANDEPAYLVFEDLREDNYRNMDRRVGLDFNATAMVMRKLAKLHAINAMIYEESPELFEPHKTRVVSRENTELLSAMIFGMKDLQQICLRWPGYEHYYDKLQHLLDNAVMNVEAVYTADPGTFNTLTHGDLWVNNIMYKFDDDNKPIDVIMVDYQIGYYGSPAIDLSYIFYTSTVNNMFEENWDRLLQIYHTELVQALHLVQYPKRVPSLIELHIQMLNKSLYALLISFAVIPPRHLDNSDEPDLDTLTSDSEETKKLRYVVYEKPEVSERIKYLLDYYDRKGLLAGLV